MGTELNPKRSTQSSAGPEVKGEGGVVTVDARGMEPPQPMVIILEKLNELPPGAILRALTDRQPMHLYQQLAKRGYQSESEAQPDGSFVTLIRRST